MKELSIEGYSIFVQEPEQLDGRPHHNSTSGIMNWTSEQLEKAVKPMLIIMDSFKNSMSNMTPDEMEVCVLAEIGLKGETPVLKILSADTSAQFSIKFTWKKS